MQLPSLDSEYPITEEQIASFRCDGHIHLPGVCSAEEISAYFDVIVGGARAAFPPQPPEEKRTTYEQAFQQTLNLRLHDPGIRNFVLAPRFAKIAAQLVGAQGMRLYHDQALFKAPGGGFTPWHQDQYYWPLATNGAIGLWMPLRDVPLEMGAIRYVTGSHKAGFLGQHEISDESQRVYDRYIEEQSLPIWSAPLKAGDCLLHSAWTLHGAGANATDQLREAMVIAFYPDGTLVDDLSNANRVEDAKVHLGGKQPGELADSAMNPVVFPGDARR